MNFKNKTAVIIGGTSGIGFSVAQKVIAHGGQVVVGGRSQDKVDASVRKLGSSASGYFIDNTDKESIADFFSKIDHLDYLFTPGASYSLGPMNEISDEVAESPFRSKFWGQYYAVKCAIPKMSSDGAIVLMSGAASVRPLKNTAAYAACNAAIEGLGKALAIDLAPIRVNVVSPGTTDSDLWQNRPDEIRQPAYEMWKTLALTKKVIAVNEVSDTVCFLLQNTGMTGSTLYVDGGYTLR